MKVILDECLPKRLISELPGYEVVTVPMVGWAGVKNGELLRKIDGHYDAFLTVDALVAQSETVKRQRRPGAWCSNPDGRRGRNCEGIKGFRG